jgi:hypothetical protein
MILRAEGTIHGESAAIMINDCPAGLAEFMRNWENSSASALERMVSMTGYWNAYKLDIAV